MVSPDVLVKSNKYARELVDDMASTGEDPTKVSVNIRLLLGGFLAFCIHNVLNSAYSTVLAIIKEELALSYTLSGALMSSYYVGYTMGQIPWGYLADRLGSRRVMTLSILGIASSTILFGRASDVGQAIAARFFSGLLGAGVFVPSVRLISVSFSPGERGTALGILSVGGSVGLIAASWAAPILTLRLGWRVSMMIFGLLGIISSAVMWSTLREGRAGGSSTWGRVEMAGFLRSGNFWILALMQFIRLGSNYTFIAWLPLLVHEEHGLGLIPAGLALTIFNFSGTLSNPAGGFISDRVGEKKALIVSFLALAAGVCLFPGVKGLPMIYIAAFTLGWFINFTRSPSFSILPRLYGVDAVGKVSGIHNTFASIGAVTLPFLLGYIKDATLSYRLGWETLSALLLCGGLALLFLRVSSE